MISGERKWNSINVFYTYKLYIDHSLERRYGNDWKYGQFRFTIICVELKIAALIAIFRILKQPHDNKRRGQPVRNSYIWQVEFFLVLLCGL